jgi:hypothetical protein
MIFVGALERRRAPWGWDFSARMISDEHEAELRSIAFLLNLPAHWMIPGPVPCYRISKRCREKALACGPQIAVEGDAQAMTAAAARYRVARGPLRHPHRRGSGTTQVSRG